MAHSAAEGGMDGSVSAPPTGVGDAVAAACIDSLCEAEQVCVGDGGAAVYIRGLCGGLDDGGFVDLGLGWGTTWFEKGAKCAIDAWSGSATVAPQRHPVTLTPPPIHRSSRCTRAG